MRFELLSVIVAVMATIDKDDDLDACESFAAEAYNAISQCNPETRFCSSLYWDPRDRSKVLYAEQGVELSSEYSPMTCDEAKSFTGIRVTKRKSTNPRRWSVRDGKPAWYIESNRPEENARVGMEKILDILAADLIPVLQEWPMGKFTSDFGASISRVLRYLEVVNSIEVGELELEAMREMCIQNNPKWHKWLLYIEDKAMIGGVTRFDQGEILMNFFPFAKLHLELVESLVDYPNYRDELLQEYPVFVEFIGEKFLAGEYLAFDHRMTLTEVDQLFSELIPRVDARWTEFKQKRFVPHIESLDADSALLRRFERLVSQLRGDLETQETTSLFKSKACVKLQELMAFTIRLRIDRIRVGNRLVLSLIRMCMDTVDIETRRNLVSLIPDVVSTRAFFQRNNLRVSSNKMHQIRESHRFLTNENNSIQPQLIIQFKGSPARGDDGPRAQWLSNLFEHYFSVQNGIFDFSDESQQFLKPSLKHNDPKSFFVIGRVIGLGIRYGLTIGARITPCLVWLLRAPSREFDLEQCVAQEDPLFVQSLRKVQDVFSWTDPEAIESFLDSIADVDGLTLESFPRFFQTKLYSKGIEPIRAHAALIRRGIRTAIPLSALEVYTDSEFMVLINGLPTLPADTLWSGIKLNRIDGFEYFADWLKEILTQQSDQFRFAFNRFVTGVPQPPVNARDPWIWISLDTNPDRIAFLPTAMTCMRSLLLPVYASKAILLEKLTTALFDGESDSLQLH